MRSDGPATHLIKEGTPTGGGILILFAIITSTLLWADVANRYVWIALIATAGMGAIGFLDDWKKIRHSNTRGITAREKLLLQAVVAAVVAIVLYCQAGFDAQLSVPFFKNIQARSRYLVCAVCNIRDRGRIQCRQSHRRA